jgi:hypothetical protein
VIIDTLAPAIVASGYDYLTEQVARFEFSEDVSATFTLADVGVTNLTTSTSVASAHMTLTRSGLVYRLRFPGVSDGILPDGNYQAAITPSGVTDVAGNPLQNSNTLLDFFVLAGDANRDRVVNLSDFNILAANFGQSGRNYSHGDLNYDSIVNLQDFNILASRFGTTLPSPQPARAMAGSAARFGSMPILKSTSPDLRVDDVPEEAIWI